MARDNVIQRTLKEKQDKLPAEIWIEGRWLFYRPSFYPTHEVQEWGGRWEKGIQAWRLPKLIRFIKRLAEFDPQSKPTRDVLRLGKEPQEERDHLCFDVIAQLAGLPLSFDRLYDYQKRAVEALVTRPQHGTLLTLSPGLGKTPTSIVAADILLREMGKEGRVLVVSPLSLCNNWAREIREWSQDSRVEIAHSIVGDTTVPTPDHSVRWTVTNYDSVLERDKDANGKTVVTGHLNEEFDYDWDAVIFDESVLLKNRKTKRVSATRTLARNSEKVWMLSGAPITRNNSDIWSQLNMLEPDYFSSFWRLAEEFCIVVKTQWSQGEILGSRRDISIREEFPEMMFVRNQEEVFEELPEYLYEDIEIVLHPKQAKAHQDVMDLWLHELEEAPSKRVEVTAVIAMLTRLQQITSNLYNLETTGTPWPDYSSKADFVEEFLEIGDLEWPCLIWVHHRPGAKALLDRIQKRTRQKGSDLYKKRAELVVGGTKNADQIIEDFKAGKVDVLLLGITVGKFGHTLSNARTVILYDKTWDSDAHFQMLHRVAGARAKLAGHLHTPVLINPRCRGTVDDYVELNLAGKLPDMANITGADLAKILRSLGKDHVS